MCESEADVQEDVSLKHTVDYMSRKDACRVGDKGVIRASVKLLDLFNDFEKLTLKMNDQMIRNARESSALNARMLGHTINMDNLTKVMLGITAFTALLTLANLILFAYQLQLLNGFGSFISGIGSFLSANATVVNTPVVNGSNTSTASNVNMLLFKVFRLSG